MNKHFPIFQTHNQYLSQVSEKAKRVGSKAKPIVSKNVD